MVDFGQNDEIIATPKAAFGADDEIITASAAPLPDELINAYVGGQMTPEEKRELEADIDAGVWQLPKGLELGKGVFERTEEPGFFQKLSNLVTGRGRIVEETESLGDWMSMPEMAEFNVPAAKAQLATIATTPEESAKIVKNMFPNVEMRQDVKGNYIFKSAIDGQEYAIKPGARLSDIPRMGATMAAFTPAGKATTIPRAFGAGAGTQAAIEASQAAAGGEFDVEQVPVAGALQALGPLASKASGAIKQGYRRFLGQAQPGPLAQTVKEAEGAGVRVMTSDILPPDTFAKKWLQRGGEMVPYVGTGVTRKAQQVQRIDAIKDVLRQFGADDLSVRAVDDVADDLIRTRGQQLTKYSDMKKQVIDGLDSAGPVPLDRTREAINSEISRLDEIGTKSLEPVKSLLRDWDRAIQGKSLPVVEQIRKELGEAFKAPDLAAVRSTGEKSLRAIYGPLKEDMGDFIAATGKRRDITKWKVANKRLAELSGELQNRTLKSVLEKAQMTPEDVKKLLFSAKPSDVRMLYRNLSPTGKQSARAALLQESLEKAGDQISPEKFVNQLKKRSNQIGILFGKDDLKAIDGLVKAIDLTRRASKASVLPESGLQSVPILGTALLSDLFGSGGAAVTGIGTIGGLARLYESAPVRNILVKLADSKITQAQQNILISELIAAAQALKKDIEND